MHTLSPFLLPFPHLPTCTSCIPKIKPLVLPPITHILLGISVFACAISSAHILKHLVCERSSALLVHTTNSYMSFKFLYKMSLQWGLPWFPQEKFYLEWKTFHFWLFRKLSSFKIWTLSFCLWRWMPYRTSCPWQPFHRCLLNNLMEKIYLPIELCIYTCMYCVDRQHAPLWLKLSL